MSSRTYHQERNHKERRKLNAAGSNKGTGIPIWSLQHKRIIEARDLQRSMFQAMVAVCLGPIMRRQKRG